VKTLAAVGKLVDTANLGDIGSSLVTPTNPVTVLQGLRSRAGGVGIVSVPTNTPSAADLDAIAAADAAIVVVGLTAPDEGEIVIANGTTIGGDRKSLDLHPDQLALIQAVSARQRRTIVVIEGSGAVIVEPFVDAVSAILLAFYPGVEGGNAIADVLFGDVDPSGKLPVTFARSADQLPPFDHTSTQVFYDYDPGYRYVDRHGAEPRYPFGFGSSYTSFALQNLSLDEASIRSDGTIRAHVDVTNTGARAGDEVVQLYLSHPASRVLRAVRELKAFQRVSLSPGETKTVGLEVPASELAYWDEASSSWVVEPETVHVEVGTSSRDLPLAADVAVGG
jgi:beta-glucosidase